MQDHTLVFPRDFYLAQHTRWEMSVLHRMGQGCPPSPPDSIAGRTALAFVLPPHSPAGASCSSVLLMGPSEGRLKPSPVSLSILVGEEGGIPMHDRKRNKIQELQVKYSVWVPRFSRAVYPN